MSDDSTTSEVTDAFPLMRVDELPIDVLIDSSDSALAKSVRRVLEQAKEKEQNYSAFGNAP